MLQQAHTTNFLPLQDHKDSWYKSPSGKTKSELQLAKKPQTPYQRKAMAVWNIGRMGAFMWLPASLVKPLAAMLFGTQVQLVFHQKFTAETKTPFQA